MIVGIHQPNYIPWLGYFYKIAHCDLFIFLDIVKYPDRGYVNRVKIKNPTGAVWLTQPVPAKDRISHTIKEICFTDDRWRKKHINTIKGNYSQAPYFNTYFKRIEEIILDKSTDRLALLNSHLIKLFMEFLDIKTKTQFSEGVSPDGNPTDRLVTLVKNAKGTVYFSGEGGANYQDEENFHNNGIELQYTDFSHPVYPQLWGDFCPGLSTLDLIFNCGPDSKKYIE